MRIVLNPQMDVLQRSQGSLGVCGNMWGTASLSCKIGSLRVLYILPKHTFSCTWNCSDWKCDGHSAFIVEAPSDFSSYLFFFFLNQRNSLCLCQIFVGGFTMKTINFVFLTFFAGLTLCQYSLVDDGMDFDFWYICIQFLVVQCLNWGALGKYVGTLQFTGVTVALSEGYWENWVRGLKESTC